MNRRESLAAVAGFAASLAGCTDFGSRSSRASPTPTARDPSSSRGPGSGTLRDPPLLQRRSDGPRPPIWFDDEDSDDAGRPDTAERRRVLESTVIDTATRTNNLTVADSVDRNPVEAFIAETDLSGETLYLEQAAVGECFRLNLCRIAWRPDKVSTDYGRETRPYDERCAVETQVFEARLIRIPDPIDSDTVNSFSRSIGTASCDEDGMRAAAESGSSSETSAEGETATAAGMDATAPAGDR